MFTIQHQHDHIIKWLALPLQTKINKEASLFSLAVNESTDINNSAQLLVFICYLSSSFELCEDLLSMETLAAGTCGEDIFIAVKNTCMHKGLEPKNLCINFCLNRSLK